MHVTELRTWHQYRCAQRKWSSGSCDTWLCGTGPFGDSPCTSLAAPRVQTTVSCNKRRSFNAHPRVSTGAKVLMSTCMALHPSYHTSYLLIDLRLHCAPQTTAQTPRQPPPPQRSLRQVLRISAGGRSRCGCPTGRRGLRSSCRTAPRPSLRTGCSWGCGLTAGCGPLAAGCRPSSGMPWSWRRWRERVSACNVASRPSRA